MEKLSFQRETVITAVCAIAQAAGREAMRFYRANTAISLKSDSSPLTDADRASHNLILAMLPPIIPGVPIISEESEDPVAAAGASAFWLVDPLDGTKEFLKGTGEFTVNIALIEHGRPVLGVVHAPVLGRRFFADCEGGSFRCDDNKAPVRIQVRQADPQKLRVVASKDHAGPLVQEMLERLPGAELKSMGSSLKFCLVAEGEADLYLRDVPTMEWDTAAAQCVVEAAGGRVCMLDGQPLRYGKAGLRNPSIVTVGDPGLAWASFVRTR